MKQSIKMKPQYRGLILFFLLGSLCTSCVQLLELDRAQSQFNQAATIENQLRFNPPGVVPSSPDMYYNSAYSTVKKALEKSSELKRDKVLANAYIIEALSAWRLKKYSEARRAASDAAKELENLEREDGIVMPRDKALMRLLPTLIDLDVTRVEMKSKLSGTITVDQSFAFYLENVYNVDPAKTAKLEGLYNKLDEERTIIEKDGNIDDNFSLYLLSVQMTILKNCSDGLDLIRITGVKANKTGQAEEFFSTQMGKEVIESNGVYGKKTILIKLLKNQISDAMLTYWKNLF